MQVSDRTIDMFSDLVTGDGRKVRDFGRGGIGITYNSGPNLVDIFKKLGFDDVYEEDFGTRWYYARERLTSLNEQDKIEEFIKYYLHPQKLLEWNEGCKINAVEIVNRYLRFDGFQIVLSDTNIEIEKLDGSTIKTKEIEEINNSFILEHSKKCEKKIQQKDFSGAITSARSLLESVLKYIHKEVLQTGAKNMELPRLYKDVAKELKIHNTSEIDQGLKKIAGGLNASVIGISEVRNKSSDSHGGLDLKYKVEEHHALLVVNAAKTIALFLFQSYKKKIENK